MLFHPSSRAFLPSLLIGMGIFASSPAAFADETEGIVKFEIEASEDGEALPGARAKNGETQHDLNQRLLESFGEKPFGNVGPDSDEARREAMRERIARNAREELLFELEARALKRSIKDREDEFDAALIPSRRFVELSRSLKNPQLLRDELERRVQQGELSPYDLLDAERGLFDATRREQGFDTPYGYGHYGRPLPSRSTVSDLLTYQSYLRAERYAQAYE